MAFVLSKELMGEDLCGQKWLLPIPQTTVRGLPLQTHGGPAVDSGQECPFLEELSERPVLTKTHSPAEGVSSEVMRRPGAGRGQQWLQGEMVLG